MAEDGDTLTTIAQARFQDSQRYGRSDYSQHTDGAESDHGQRYTLVLKLAHTPAHTDAHATAREWHRRRLGWAWHCHDPRRRMWDASHIRTGTLLNPHHLHLDWAAASRDAM